MLRPKQFGRLGEFYLHESILDVLLDNQQEKIGLGAAEISRRAGIYRNAGKIGMNDAIVSGCLNDLCDQGKVQKAKQESGRGGCRLTNEEYERRRDDI